VLDDGHSAGANGACTIASTACDLAFAMVHTEEATMSHASNIVYCDGPHSPHAFDVVPLQPRRGSLDAICPVCQGRGQWNTEIDLVSFRSKRTACDQCHGAGWVETGSDPVGVPDIEVSPEGYPRWTLRYEPPHKSYSN